MQSQGNTTDFHDGITLISTTKHCKNVSVDVNFSESSERKFHNLLDGPRTIPILLHLAERSSQGVVKHVFRCGHYDN